MLPSARFESPRRLAPAVSVTRHARWPGVVRSLGLALTLVACGPRQGREIRIGLLASLQGDYSEASGIPSLEGARLAIDEINARGGILVDGRRHRLVLVERHHDMRGDAAASAARASINLDRVDLLIGPQLSAAAQAAGAVAEASGVPMISPMSSNPATTEGRRFVFRLAFLDAFQGTMLADYARKELGARTAAVLYDVAQPYSAEIARLFGETFERNGGTVIATETFTSDQFDHFMPQLRRIGSRHPDVLLLPNRPRVVSVQVREARAAGVRATLLGSDTWDLTSMAPMPEADGAFIVHQWHPDLPLAPSVAFVSAYQARYGSSPRATAALTYDAIRLAADAMARAGQLDGAAIADAIAATARFDGASGTLRFEGRHDPDRTAVLSTISHGGHHLVRVVGAAR